MPRLDKWRRTDRFQPPDARQEVNRETAREAVSSRSHRRAGRCSRPEYRLPGQHQHQWHQRNDQYGFSFQIADRFKQGDSASFSQSTGSAALNVAFFDPNGAKAGDQSIDAFMTSVYVLKQPITTDLMPAMKTELDKALQQLKAADSSVKMQPLTETTVNGIPGWKTDYTMDMSGTPVQARTYFLVKGATEYQITIQSSTANWSKNEPDLQKAVDSFKVK